MSLLPPQKVRRIDPVGAEQSDIRARLRAARARLDGDDTRSQGVATRWANLVVAMSFIAVVYCTLFPFNFTRAPGETWLASAGSFYKHIYDPSDPKDSFDNIILFLPFGFALGCLVTRLGWKKWMLPVIGLLVSTLFSSSIETLQLWLPTRDSSLADICSNSTGGLLGACIYLGIGDATLSLLERSLRRARQNLTVGRIAVVFIVAWVATLYSPLHLYHDGKNLANWRPYLLTCGNVPTGARPWKGSVQLVEISAQSLNPQQAHSVMNGKPLREVLPASANVTYLPTVNADAPDLAGKGPSLNWVGPSRPDMTLAGETAISHDHWLQTAEPPTALIDEIRRVSAFSMHVVFESALSFQRDQPRITTLSPSEMKCDISLLQDNTDLNLRIRTPLSGDDGRNPVWMVRNLFGDNHLKHDVLITYADPMLRIYVDGAQNGSAVTMPPEFFSLGRLMARTPNLPLGGFGLEIYRALFYFAWFTPLGAILGLMAADIRTPIRTRLIFATAGILLPPALLEAIYVFIGGRELGVLHMLMGAGVLLIILLVARSWFIRRLGQYDVAAAPANVIDVPGRY